jgi:hypothetical protein
MKKLMLRSLLVVVPLLVAAVPVKAQNPDEKKAAAPEAAKAAMPAVAARDGMAPVARPAGQAPGPKPATELDSFKFFLGKWKCEGKAFASPMTGPEHAFKATAEAKLVSDNFWQSFTYEEKKSKVHPGLKVQGLWGFDQGGKHFVRAGAGNNGSWDSATAPLWQGDRLVWTGEISGAMGKMPFHHTFTKKSDKEWTHALEIKTPDGKWAPVSEATCKK